MAALSVRGLILKPAPALVSLAPSCNFASEVRPREINTAAMKRGRGGRSSFSGDVVTVFGSNGFIGTAIANRYRKRKENQEKGIIFIVLPGLGRTVLR